MRAFKCDLCNDYMDIPANQDETFEVVVSDVGGTGDAKIRFRMSMFRPGEAKKPGDYCPECAKKIATNALGKMQNLAVVV